MAQNPPAPRIAYGDPFDRSMRIDSPLHAAWSVEPVRLWLPGVVPGTPLSLTIDSEPADFQYTSQYCIDRGAQVVVLLGLGVGQGRTLHWTSIQTTSGQSALTDLSRVELPVEEGALIGTPSAAIRIPAPIRLDGAKAISGPFGGFAGFPLASSISCEKAFEGATLARTNAGPLFEDYELVYLFHERRSYSLSFRFWKHEPMVEVSEAFSLGMDAALSLTLNPGNVFDSILSRDSFEGESQPTVEPLATERIRDVLCRLQMPTLSEYFIPNNRGWFALLDDKDHRKGMLGILGLYGARWQEPVANMPEVYGAGSSVRWQASLCSGERHFLLYAGPVEKDYAADRRFVFHRLHAQFNALRLDEHLDLAGSDVFDEPTDGGFFEPGDYHARARERMEEFTAMKQVLSDPGDWLNANGGMHLASYRYLLDPTPERAVAVYDHLIRRFGLWVRQFQGWRTGVGDYMKNVIGFTRYLRGMLLAYEMLRRDNVLTREQLGRLNAYFVFAARRITDEGRWPHSRTTLHPDHPESSRDFYAYGGEHKPDRLYWTNCLPNFQSDPLCALAHLSVVFRRHPDAAGWLRFALDDIDGQLDAYCGKSGAWEESINYALYTFSYFVITFRALKAHAGIDYFADPRVRRMAGWLVRFLGPKDKRWNLYTWPGVGNAVCPSGGGQYVYCFAGQLPMGDPLRDQLVSAWQKLEPSCKLEEHYPVVFGALAPRSEPAIELSPLESESMEEVGVAMRDRHTLENESYLFQKIGFAKDHYEGDETAFNWYAKGTPFCMDYGTYTGDVGVAGAHNLVEIPDEDSLRRGYLKNSVFTPALDYTHCEVPVTLKLLWGKVRSFEEVENKDGKIDRTKTPYFYIGDRNPVGPKTWKVRLLLFVKPDYMVLFDRVYGRVPHRYNLHVTGDDIRRDGNLLQARGRFDLDLLAYVHHPASFDLETGEIIPNSRAPGGPSDSYRKHAQHYMRIYNRHDGVYRTVLFAKERDRDVRIDSLGRNGVRIVTPQYTDHVYLNDQPINEAGFVGRSGWIRRDADGRVQASVIDGERIQAFGMSLNGRGPWTYNMKGDGKVELLRGPDRKVVIS